MVPANASLASLHEIIQPVMGWQRLHDYSFQVGLGLDCRQLDNEKSLAEALHVAGDRPLYYNYDSKSGWRHRLIAEPLANEVDSLPVCLAGASACPPEDSGGVWGYDQLLARLEDMEDPDYVELLDRYGDFDPDAFDLSAANARLLESPAR